MVPDVRAALQQPRTPPSQKVPFTAGHRHNRQQRQDNIERMAPPPAFSSIHTVRSPRSYNSQIGVPLSLWEITPDAELGIFEAGISEKGEMDALREMIAPTIGVITNVGIEHADGFASRSDKCDEKSNYSQHARKSYILSMIHCSPKEQHARFSPSAASP